MDKFNQSQMLKLFLMALLLSLTPLVSTPLRPPYLYFVVNLLVIVLGAEAGLLSFICRAAEDKRPASTNVVRAQKQQPLVASFSEDPPKVEAETTTKAKKKPLKAAVVEKSSSEKIHVGAAGAKVDTMIVRKSPSTPSLFFIGGGETEGEEFLAEEEEELSGQELFNKAETFIGNFYKQLEMQREESWKKIHELYHKAPFDDHLSCMHAV